MAHFYGSICGNKGDATRMGSKDSGFRAWAQGWGSRVTARMYHNHHTEEDEATITLGPGPSSHSRGSLSLSFPDADTVVAALGTGDERIKRIVERIHDDIDKLNAEAPKAIKRAELTRKREQRERERQDKAERERKLRMLDVLNENEQERIARLTGISFDRSVNSADNILLALDRRVSEFKYGNDMHAIITTKLNGAYALYDFDATAGQWILPFEPDDIGIVDPIKRSGFGYRIEREEQAA